MSFGGLSADHLEQPAFVDSLNTTLASLLAEVQTDQLSFEVSSQDPPVLSVLVQAADLAAAQAAADLTSSAVESGVLLQQLADRDPFKSRVNADGAWLKRRRGGAKMERGRHAEIACDMLLKFQFAEAALKDKDIYLFDLPAAYTQAERQRADRPEC